MVYITYVIYIALEECSVQLKQLNVYIKFSKRFALTYAALFFATDDLQNEFIGYIIIAYP